MDYGSAEDQERSLKALRRELDHGRTELEALWGVEGYASLAEMVEVEMASIAVRANREDHYDLSVRLRESAMKRLADLRMADYPHRTVLNVGGNHAQKKHLKGTSQEWLGDYLVHQSSSVSGSAYVLGIVPARVVPYGGGDFSFDLMEASPENELFRLMFETFPGESVFLPLDDPVFAAGGVPTNFEGTIYVCALKEQYDGMVLYPTGHRAGGPL
jgi:hypothetical protein